MERLLRSMMEQPQPGGEGGGGAGADKVKAVLINNNNPVPVRTDGGGETTEIDEWDLQIRRIAGPAQMIAADSTFYDDAVEEVINNSAERWDYAAPAAVISLLGSQGRSFLLNSLFGVKFNDNDDPRGRNQNMKGVRLLRCAGPPLIVLDIEVSDDKEEDYLFEKQAVLFTLSLSDLLVVNISLQELIRDSGGNIQLLRTIMEERLASKLDSGQTKLLIVIHGYDEKLSLTKLQEDVLTKLQKWWALIHSPGLDLSEFFEVLVVGLPDGKSKPQDFEEKVLKMKRWLSEVDITVLKKDRILAQGFSLSAKGIWDAIRQKKQLGVFLFGHKITVSDTICGNIVSDTLSSAESNKNLLSLKKADRGTSKEFTEKLASHLEASLKRFDTESQMFDEDVRHKKRGELEKNICALVESTCKEILAGLHMKTFNESKMEIANQLSEFEEPTTGIADAVKACITKFVESCEDLRSRYPDLFNEHRDALEIELNTIAEIIASNIEEKRKREEVERAKAEAEQKAQDAKMQAEKTKETASIQIEQYKKELASARSQADHSKSEAERAKEESKKIAKHSIEEIHRISRLAKAEHERVKKELEIVKEEQRKEREQAKEAAAVEARRRKNQMRLDMVRAVVVVARVVVFKDPTVIVDIVDFAFWHGKRSKGETLGSDPVTQNGKDH